MKRREIRGVRGPDCPGLRVAPSGLRSRLGSPYAASAEYGEFVASIAPDCVALHPSYEVAWVARMKRKRNTGLFAVVAVIML